MPAYFYYVLGSYPQPISKECALFRIKMGLGPLLKVKSSEGAANDSRKPRAVPDAGSTKLPIKKELSLNINKFQNNLHKGSSDGSQEELIRNAFYVIKSFGEVDNNFKPLFLDIQARVKEYLFISDP